MNNTQQWSMLPRVPTDNSTLTPRRSILGVQSEVLADHFGSHTGVAQLRQRIWFQQQFRERLLAGVEFIGHLISVHRRRW